MTFESFTSLSALAAVTRQVRLGHIVACAGFRNPALVTKMISTMDVISGGRMELGIGAGWKQEEWLAYGYEFPERKERLERLRDTLAVARAMLGPGRATYEGKHAGVAGAINLPKPLQERLPIMVGGNGQNVTWRLAAEFADELNVDGMPPEDVAKSMPIIRQRCEEIGRDPETLRVSAHIWWEQLDAAPSRQDLLAAYAQTGVVRVQALIRAAAQDVDEIDAFAEDCRAAGATLNEGVVATV
jgi:alkanesulfonate monooxygenase SsuD/methylene tetrahydromethanopterin reductase-like flavin-dependent oxidoreductase (luciferase family)